MTTLDRSPARLMRWTISWAAAPVLFFLLIAVAEIVLMLRLNDGFYYIQDDAYIHLALSERLARLHYGINSGESASPSSSVLWPFLLAPFASARWHHLVPIAINIAAQLCTMALLHRAVHLSFEQARPAFSAAIAILIAWCGGSLATVFFGLEHSLHLMVTMAAILGLILLKRDGRLRPWLPLALALGPLIRYEAAALLLCGLVLLWLGGHRRAALLTAIASGIPILGFTLFLLGQDLPPLPGSVLVKLNEQLDPGAGKLATIIRTLNLRSAQATDRGVLLVLSVLIVAAVQTRRAPWLAAIATSLFLLHFAFGSWLERYLVYLQTALLLCTVHLLAPALDRMARRMRPAAMMLLLLIMAAPVALEPGRALLRVPGRGQDIRLQQTQMHRFVTQYWKRPVAVTDLGRISYRNPHYVLDLWGLGSEAARRARSERDGAWIGEVAQEQGVMLAMVFDSWIGSQIPGDWVRLGALRMRPGVATAIHEEVAFYAAAGAASELIPLLRAFARTLPAGASFAFAGED